MDEVLKEVGCFGLSLATVAYGILNFGHASYVMGALVSVEISSALIREMSLWRFLSTFMIHASLLPIALGIIERITDSWYPFYHQPFKPESTEPKFCVKKTDQ